MTQPSVSVIIVNFNTREQTLECIESVYAESRAMRRLGPPSPPPLDNLTVIVVDNGSVDGSADAIRERFPAAVVVEAGENLGFARGVNRGVDASTDEYILLLNPDTVVIPGSLRSLVSFAVRNPDYGLYGGRTLRPDGTVDPSSAWGETTLWSLTSFALGLSTAFKHSLLFDPESLGEWKRDSVREVPIITGCLTLIRRDTFAAIGRMDERFFLYGEDAEFSVRARRFGLRPVIVPSAVIVHDVGGSTGNSGRKMSLVMAGKVTLLTRSWSPARARLGIVLLQAGSLLRAALEIATRSPKRTWLTVWRARAKWRTGYPDAEAALFGRTPPHRLAPERTARNQPLRVEAEPAFRTQHANPYNARLYAAMPKGAAEVRDLGYLRLLWRRTDIVHLHWPDLTFLSGPRRWRQIARLVLFFSFLTVARRNGTRLIWTVHNIASHENRSTPRIRSWYSRLLLGNVDGILALTTDGITAARTAYPELRAVPAFVTPHGDYRDSYNFSASRADARRALGVPDGTVMVSVGQIRSYKNLPHLVDVFARRAARVPAGAELDVFPTEILAIAGKPADAELRDALSTAAAGTDSVILDLQFLPDDRLATWLRAADVVVLPYSRVQNSGSAILALSADRPVVVPAIGAMTELQQQVGADWVYTFEGSLTAEVLDDVAVWLRDTERGESPNLAALAWPAIAAQTLAAYRAVLDNPPPLKKDRFP
ncbi:GT2 family glycosyltransferase [Okibacterium sp. HSC-33S16]|uniref:glycosyltransferase n=1 Tax=Okibacterium sp. HSC-33S16 TaxID=2910965 RepID=UPI0020A07611|nr:glycosyltransferase [Okibacterium sp. HSC-33S16]MCP2032075.1 GT2 family glycosyltransferase [Okibacterium sp. HSC-33S16]